jgi:chaperonin GroEL (HSP60 family)
MYTLRKYFGFRINKCWRKWKPPNKQLLTNFAFMFMDTHELSPLVVTSALLNVDRKKDRYSIDIENINILKLEGGSIIKGSELNNGLILEKPYYYAGQEEWKEGDVIEIRDVKLVLLHFPILTPKDQNEEKRIIENIITSEANTIFTSFTINCDVLEKLIDKADIRRIVENTKKIDMLKLANATGAKVASDLEELSEYGSTYCEKLLLIWLDVFHPHVGLKPKEFLKFVIDSKNPRVVSFLLRDSDETILNKTEVEIKGTLTAIKGIIENPM